MATRTVLEHPDPRLRRRCEPVTRFDDALHTLVLDLVDTLYAGHAIGLSAPQIDVPVRVLVVDVSAERCTPQVLVNPTLLARSRFGLVEERCASVPGLAVNVVRATKVRVRAATPVGAVFERDLDGLDAVCVQHEMDHFEGKLLVDRLSFFGRWRYARR